MCHSPGSPAAPKLAYKGTSPTIIGRNSMTTIVYSPKDLTELREKLKRELEKEASK